MVAPGIEQWDFDVLAAGLEAPLVAVTLEAFRSHGLCEALGLRSGRLGRWAASVERHYKEGNAYHTKEHAADVTAAASWLAANMEQPLTPVELLALFVAAAGHDAGHFARNNRFLANSNHQLHVKYGGTSALERFHADTLLAVVDGEGLLDACEKLSAAQKDEVRELVLELVLATDMAQHGQHMARQRELQAKRRAGARAWLRTEGRRTTLCALLKNADLSNVFRPLEISEKWGDLILEEFYAQAEQERRKGLVITTYAAPVSLAQHQHGFAANVVLPALHLFAETHLTSSAGTKLLQHARANVSSWGDALVRLAKEEQVSKLSASGKRSSDQSRSVKRLKSLDGSAVEQAAGDESEALAPGAPEPVEGPRRPGRRRLGQKALVALGAAALALVRPAK